MSRNRFAWPWALCLVCNVIILAWIMAAWTGGISAEATSAHAARAVFGAALMIGVHSICRSLAGLREDQAGPSHEPR